MGVAGAAARSSTFPTTGAACGLAILTGAGLCAIFTCGEPSLSPTDVSFADVSLTEGGRAAAAVGSGDLLALPMPEDSRREAPGVRSSAASNSNGGRWA